MQGIEDTTLIEHNDQQHTNRADCDGAAERVVVVVAVVVVVHLKALAVIF